MRWRARTEKMVAPGELPRYLLIKIDVKKTAIKMICVGEKNIYLLILFILILFIIIIIYYY